MRKEDRILQEMILEDVRLNQYNREAKRIKHFIDKSNSVGGYHYCLFKELGPLLLNLERKYNRQISFRRWDHHLDFEYSVFIRGPWPSYPIEHPDYTDWPNTEYTVYKQHIYGDISESSVSLILKAPWVKDNEWGEGSEYYSGISIEEASLMVYDRAEEILKLPVGKRR